MNEDISRFESAELWKACKNGKEINQIINS